MATAPTGTGPGTETYTPRLKVNYRDEIRPQIAAERGLNVMAVPTLKKIIVNMGVGEATREPKLLD
ncbi:MAG: 50S ribosomal protein L5, partial [Acidimicrobiia bacterium]